MDPWWARYAQRAQVFANDGKGNFRDVSAANPALCGAACVGRSLAAGDLDGDGAPDLVLCSVAGPARILKNVVPRRGHWVALHLEEPKFGGRDAIGAEAVLVAGGKRRWAVLQPATSYLSSHEAALHFGLGAVATFDGVEVAWADGTRERFPGGAADRRVVLRHGEGTAEKP